MKKTSYDVWIFPLPSGLEIRLRDVPQEDLDFLDSIEQKTARVAELEAVLRECREVLVHCAGVFDEVRGYPITYDLTIEAITKIYEVLK